MLRLAPLLMMIPLAMGIGSEGTARRNVLYMVFDDFRPVLPFYGHREVSAPHMEKLANKSMVFDRAYCNQAVCSPSRNRYGLYLDRFLQITLMRTFVGWELAL